MTNSGWITLFQWLSLTGSVLAVASFIGLWVFTDRLQREKDHEINQLQNVTEAVRGFSDMAQLDAAGLPFRESGSIRYDSPLSTALRDLYVSADSQMHFKLGQEFEPKYRAIINDFPRFPFAYFALAESLRLRGDPSWREYATKAMSILEKTTMIEGHNHSHDEALSKLKTYMAQ
jgi:hypothetical protein